MREIKFRVWHKMQQKMVPWERLILPEGNRSYNPDWINLAEAIKNHNKGNDTLPFMQYTGLKDKNGKEIYEGDIVRMLYTDWGDEEGSKKNGFVEWKIDEYVLNFGKSKYGENDYGSLRPGEHGYMEVIGNIYENPELVPNPKPL